MDDRPKYDTFLTRGDCFDFSLTYKADGTVVNLAGYSSAMTIYWKYIKPGTKRVYIEGKYEIVGTITAVVGLIEFHADAVDTEDLPIINTAQYQVHLTAPDGCTSTILVGAVKIFKNLFEAIS